MNRTECSI